MSNSILITFEKEHIHYIFSQNTPYMDKPWNPSHDIEEIQDYCVMLNIHYCVLLVL